MPGAPGRNQRRIAAKDRKDRKEETTQVFISAFFAFLCGKIILGIARFMTHAAQRGQSQLPKFDVLTGGAEHL
jgi:hypothetical protein